MYNNIAAARAVYREFYINFDGFLTPKPGQKCPNCTGVNFPKVWRHFDNRNMFLWNFMFSQNSAYFGGIASGGSFFLKNDHILKKQPQIQITLVVLPPAGRFFEK